MQIKYIFILKQKNTTKNITILPIDEFLNNLFENVNENSFDYRYNNKIYNVNYSLSRNINDCFYLNITLDTKKDISAKVLSYIHEVIIKNQYRRDYLIVTTYSQPSEYFCNKLSDKFNKFERTLRELIYNVVIKSYGTEWFEITTNMDTKNDIKKRASQSNTKVQENGLYEFTLFQLIDYLFMPIPYEEFSTLLETDFTPENIKLMTKEDLITSINKCRPISLWDKLFISQNLEIKNIEDRINNARKCRNIIAHNKLLTYEYFKDNEKLINKLNLDLEKAIVNIEDRIFSKEEAISIGYIISSVQSIIENLSTSFTPLIEASNQMSKNLSQFATTISPSINKLGNIMLSLTNNL